MNTVRHVVVPMFVTFTLQLLCKFQYIFLMELIDTWHERNNGTLKIKLFNLTTLLRQIVPLSGEFVPIDWFPQTNFPLTTRIWSAWLIFSDSLLQFSGNLLHLNNFLKKNVSAWEVETFFFKYLLLITFCRLESEQHDWQQLLLWLCAKKFFFIRMWIIFSQCGHVNLPFLLAYPYIARSKISHLDSILCHFFSCIASQLVMILTFTWNESKHFVLRCLQLLFRTKNTFWGLLSRNNKKDEWTIQKKMVRWDPAEC